MPFGGWFDSYYEDIYVPAIEACGLKPHRADDLYRPSTIIQDIWSYTKRSKIVLADLTGKNPNVFYELGLGHALAKPAILVTESIEDAPFDLRALRVIEYNRHDPEWGSILANKIKKSIKEVIEAPIEAVLPTFLNVKGSTEKPSITPSDKQLLELRQEMDLLRRQMRMQEPNDDIQSDLLRDVRAPSLRIDNIRYLERHIRNGAPIDWLERQCKERGISPRTLNAIIRSTRRAMKFEKLEKNRSVSNTAQAEDKQLRLLDSSSPRG